MQNNLLPKVFLWMFVGLLITFATGFYVSINSNILYNIFSTNIYWILVIIELVLVVWLSARIKKMNPFFAKIMFAVYSFVTGLTLSSIFVVYKLESIILIFLVSAIIFFVFAILGYLCKLDLSKFGVFLFMALIGIVLCTVINIFLNNTTFDIVISSISVVIFVGFTAYDVQKIKYLPIDNENYAIIGALQLYLDFINIFLDLLRLFGKSDR